MAILTLDQLAELRRGLASKQVTVNYDKPTINKALQAIEDAIESQKLSLSAKIDQATAPIVLSKVQKDLLVEPWFEQKFKEAK